MRRRALSFGLLNENLTSGKLSWRAGLEKARATKWHDGGGSGRKTPIQHYEEDGMDVCRKDISNGRKDKPVDDTTTRGENTTPFNILSLPVVCCDMTKAPALAISISSRCKKKKDARTLRNRRTTS